MDVDRPVILFSFPSTRRLLEHYRAEHTHRMGLPTSAGAISTLSVVPYSLTLPATKHGDVRGARSYSSSTRIKEAASCPHRHQDAELLGHFDGGRMDRGPDRTAVMGIYGAADLDVEAVGQALLMYGVFVGPR